MKKAIISFLGLLVFVSANLVISGMSSGAYIVDSDPDIGETDISVETWITIQFNTTMDRDSVINNLDINPELKYGYRTEWNEDNTELIIKPNAVLVYSRNYTISFTGAEDADGYPLEDPIIYFETESEQEVIEGTSFESWRNFILITILIILGLALGICLLYILSKRGAEPG